MARTSRPGVTTKAPAQAWLDSISANADSGAGFAGNIWRVCQWSNHGAVGDPQGKA